MLQSAAKPTVDLDSTFSPQTPDKPKSRRRYHRGRGRAGNGAKHRSSLLHNSARRTRPGKKGQRLRFSRRGFSRELRKVDSDIRSHSLGLNFSDNKVSVSSRCDLRPPLANATLRPFCRGRFLCICVSLVNHLIGRRLREVRAGSVRREIGVAGNWSGPARFGCSAPYR